MSEIINKLFASHRASFKSLSDPRRLSSPPDKSSTTNRQCADCKKATQVQCLHCSKYVCMECAQKHVTLANEQVDGAQHILNDKLSILDCLSAAAKEHVTAARNRIVQQVDAEQNRDFIRIDQLLEQQKKQVQEKSKQLSQQSLNEIPAFIEQMKSDLNYLSETNQELFSVATKIPKIHLQRPYSLIETIPMSGEDQL